MRTLDAAQRAILIAFIVLAGFFARAATYREPLLEHHAWRQTDTAAIARNFLSERFNILYPQIDQRGAQEYGHVATGVELLAFAVAAVSKLTGFSASIGRLLNAFVFIGSCLLVSRFTRRRYGTEAELVAAFLYAFGFPLLVFIERAFMNEALLIFLSIACFASADVYLERGRRRHLAVLVLASTLVALVKLPYLVVWAPVAGLFVERRGWRGLLSPALLLMAGVNLAAAAAWYLHALQLSSMTGLSFGLTDKLFDASLVFSARFPLLLLERFAKDVLGPVLLVALPVGAWVCARHRRWFEVLGLAGYAAYLLVVAVGNYHHDYYQLVLMPIAPVLGSVGLLHLASALGSPARREVRVAVLLALVALSSFARQASAHSWYDYAAEDLVLSEALPSLSARGDRIVMVGIIDPKIFYHADRKGWLLSDGAGLSEAIRGGARLVILHRHDESQVLGAVRDAGGVLVFSTSSYEVFRLR